MTGADNPTSNPPEPFALVNKPARGPRAEFGDTHAAQFPLFSGLDCLPGQQDLFAGLDGSAERSETP